MPIAALLILHPIQNLHPRFRHNPMLKFKFKFHFLLRQL